MNLIGEKGKVFYLNSGYWLSIVVKEVCNFCEVDEVFIIEMDENGVILVNCIDFSDIVE